MNAAGQTKIRTRLADRNFWADNRYVVHISEWGGSTNFRNVGINARFRLVAAQESGVNNRMIHVMTPLKIKQ